MSQKSDTILKDKQYYKFCVYGFLKNLRFFEPFLIIFFLEKGFSLTHVGILYAIREISINISEIPSGIIADSLGRRKTLATSFLLYISSFFLFFIADTYIILAIGMILFALGDATRSGINKAMIISYLETTNQLNLKVEYYGHTRSWSQIGSAISSLIGGILVFFTNQLNLIFIFSIIPSFLDFINVLSYPKFLDKFDRSNANFKLKLSVTLKDFIEAIRNKYLLLAIVNVSIYSGFYKSIKDFIQPFIKATLISLPILITMSDNEKVSIFLGVLYFIIFIINSFSSRFSFKVVNLIGSSKKFLNFSLLIGSILGIITGIFMNFALIYMAILSFIIILSIENLRKPSGVSILTDKSKNTTHAGVLSVASQLASIFASLFVILLGFIADQFGVGIGLMFLSFVMLISSLFIKVK